MSTERTDYLMSHMIDPFPAVTVGVELFPDDPRDPVPAPHRHARVRLDTGEIYLSTGFVGGTKIKRATQSNCMPKGTVPSLVDSDTLYVSLDWLEQSLPEYASLWARIRMSVEGATA